MSLICQYLIFPICSLKSKEFSAKYFVISLDKHIYIQVEWAVRVPLDYIIHLAHFYRQNDDNNATRKTTYALKVYQKWGLRELNASLFIQFSR